MSELFVLNNGQVITDERQSRRMFSIAALQPEAAYREDEQNNYTWDDMGTGLVFSQIYAEEIVFCVEQRTWYVYDWDSGMWKADLGDCRIHALCKEFVQLLTLYATQVIKESDTAKAYAKYVVGLGKRPARERIIKDASSDHIISVVDFDSDPRYIGCKNGVYDIETGEILPHSPVYKLTLSADCVLRDGVDDEMAVWSRFVNEVAGDSAEYLQKALGYALSGNPCEECMFLLWGRTSRNGKSTLLNSVLGVLGDYASSVPTGIITSRSTALRDTESASPMLAALQGKRFITMSETRQGVSLQSEVLKALTGGEKIPARSLYSDPVYFRLAGSFWMSCNHLPKVEDKTLFMSNRLRVIPFEKHFDEKTQDRTLKTKFLSPEYKSAIFRWLCEGYKMYCEEGIDDYSPSMSRALQDYMTMSTPFVQFMSEQHQGTWVRGTLLHKQYLQYESTCPTNLRDFYRLVEESGYRISLRHNAKHVYTTRTDKNE